MDDNLANNNNLPEKPQETDRWGSPQSSGSDDSSRWYGELYSPESDHPSSQNADRAPETVVITEPTSGTTMTKKDDGFPVWAAGEHDPHEDDGHHGSGRRQASVERKLADGQGNGLYVGVDLSRLWPCRLSDGKAVHSDILGGADYVQKEDGKVGLFR